MKDARYSQAKETAWAERGSQCGAKSARCTAQNLRDELLLSQLQTEEPRDEEASAKGQLSTELTDADWSLPGPFVVLQADPHGGPHQPETGVALIDDRVPVAEAIATDVAIDDGVWGATVAGCKEASQA